MVGTEGYTIVEFEQALSENFPRVAVLKCYPPSPFLGAGQQNVLRFLASTVLLGAYFPCAFLYRRADLV